MLRQGYNRSWLVCPRPQRAARLRLLCFPYAGAGASAYRAWANELPSSVEMHAIQLPGRESRYREAPFDDLRSAARELANAILPTIQEPFAVFGHSMGAWLAYEFAKLTVDLGLLPVRLFLSGRRAPHLPERFPLMAHLGDRELVQALEERCGGMAPEILENPELLAVLVRALRADVKAVEAYPRSGHRPLAIPLSILGGEGDRFVSRAELEGWSELTTAPASVETFPGGHFFIHSQRPRVLALIVAGLAIE